MKKNIVFIIFLIILVFEFVNSFNQLTELIETNQPNQPYIQAYGGPLAHEEHYVRTYTLQIYNYKLIQTILLLFGVFMCLVFMAINNHDFSLKKLIEVNKDE